MVKQLLAMYSSSSKILASTLPVLLRLCYNKQLWWSWEPPHHSIVRRRSNTIFYYNKRSFVLALKILLKRLNTYYRRWKILPVSKREVTGISLFGFHPSPPPPNQLHSGCVHSTSTVYHLLVLFFLGGVTWQTREGLSSSLFHCVYILPICDAYIIYPRTPLKSSNLIINVTATSATPVCL
jgi:hypothetical protein